MSLEGLIRVGVLVATLIFARPTAERPPVATKQEPAREKVTACQLKSDPAKYNHRVVEVTGFVSHGFEDFALDDPTCASRNNIWLDYGGTKESDTMYCCGVTPGQTRPQQVSVENISIPLVDDVHFQEFDRIIRSRADTVMHATIVGRFFSGQETKYATGTFWSGYGHMGCCSLLMIQQVLAVDARTRNDLDYGASADQPNIDKAGGCYSFLRDDGQSPGSIDLQRSAESGDRAWAFDNPERVAAESLARFLKIDESEIKGMRQTRRAQGRFVYEGKPKQGKVSYMIVVSRPYWLSFYAQDPNRVTWVVMAAYRLGCP